MTVPPEDHPHPLPDADDEVHTGLPGVPSWRGVYALVLLVFVGLVIAMTIFSRAYS